LEIKAPVSIVPLALTAFQKSGLVLSNKKYRDHFMHNRPPALFVVIKAAGYLALTLMVAAILYVAVLSVTNWTGITV